MASRLTGIPVKTIRDNCANGNIRAILSEGVWIIEIISLFEHFKREKYSISYDYGEFIAEIYEELEDGILSVESLVKVVRGDIVYNRYAPIIDWFYFDDDIDGTFQVSTVLSLLEEMKFHNKIIK